MKTQVMLEIKTGVFLELDDYNRMRKADTLLKLENQTIIVLVHNNVRIAMAIPSSTKMYQLANCIMHLIGVEYPISTSMRTSDGCIIEAGRSLEQERIKDGTPFFAVPASGLM